MIKKLRIKFIAVNMGIVTLMLCMILGLVYCFTSLGLENQSIRMMKRVASRPFAQSLPDEPGEEVRLPFFSVCLGPNDEQIAVDGSYYDLTDRDTLKKLVDKAIRSPHRVGTLPQYKLRYCLVEIPRGRYLVFADISSEIDTLDTLVRNSLLIGGISWIVFLIVSILLSGWAVRPVDKAFRQQQQFVADASHELKTPLTVIMTNAQIMEGAELPSASRERFVQNILTMSRQMKELIEQMLELARTDSPQYQLAGKSISFSRAVENTLLPYEPLFFEKGLTLNSQIEPDIVLCGDETKLRHVLEILLDNALKYTDPHGSAWVRLSRRGKHRCILTVADEGQPLTPVQLENMFTRFYRADESRCRDGSYGLGLAIAQSIVKAHGGKIWVTSKDGINACHAEFPC